MHCPHAKDILEDGRTNTRKESRDEGTVVRPLTPVWKEGVSKGEKVKVGYQQGFSSQSTNAFWERANVFSVGQHLVFQRYMLMPPEDWLGRRKASEVESQFPGL